MPNKGPLKAVTAKVSAKEHEAASSAHQDWWGCTLDSCHQGCTQGRWVSTLQGTTEGSQHCVSSAGAAKHAVSISVCTSGLEAAPAMQASLTQNKKLGLTVQHQFKWPWTNLGWWGCSPRLECWWG